MIGIILIISLLFNVLLIFANYKYYKHFVELVSMQNALTSEVEKLIEINNILQKSQK